MTTTKLVYFCFFLFAGLSAVAQALPSKCLQAVERHNICPHFIYKKAALAVAVLDVDKGGVICICLSDLQVLRHTAMSQVEQIDHQVTLQRIANRYQLSEQDILTLIRK